MPGTWRLADAEERHRSAQGTFEIPVSEVRVGLEPGDLVKLIFELVEPVPECGAERMWVEVNEVLAGGYRGELINEPQHIADLKCGDLIEFEPRHVAAQAEGDHDQPPVAAVNKRVSEGTFPILLIHSSSNPETNDDFWYVFVGDESADERGDGKNFDWRPLSELVESFPAMAEVFDSGITDGYWRWSASDERYVRRDFPSEREP